MKQKFAIFIALAVLLISLLSYKLFKKSSKSINKNVINRVFVISLDRTPERFEKSTEILMASNLNQEQIEKLSAVDGYNIEIYDYQAKKTFRGKDLKEKNKTFIHKNKYKIKCNEEIYFDYIAYDANLDQGYYGSEKEFKYNSKFMSSGEFGCTCSHLKALNEAKKRNYQNILIFEDDVLIPKNRNKNFNLNNFINENINKMNECGDVNFLYSYLLYKNNLLNKIKIKLLDISNTLINKTFFNYLDTPYNDFWVTVSYFANSKFMDIVLNAKEINMPVDRLYSNLIFKNRKVKGCFVKPIIFDHPDILSPSTISNMGR